MTSETLNLLHLIVEATLPSLPESESDDAELASYADLIEELGL